MKQYGLEFIGSFLFGLALIYLAQNPLGVGCIYIAVLYMTNWEHTGFYNPATTVALYAQKIIDCTHMLGLLIAQSAGMVAAAACTIGMFGEPPYLVVPYDMSLRFAAGMEVVLAALFVAVVVAVRKNEKQAVGSILVGIAFMGAASFCTPLNPAFAWAAGSTAFLHGGGVCALKDLAIYSIAPFIGAALGVGYLQLKK